MRLAEKADIMEYGMDYKMKKWNEKICEHGMQKAWK